jgi:hypothetical protein
MHEHGCLHFHIKNKNLYKTEPNKLIVPFKKKSWQSFVKNKTQEQILDQFKLKPI